MHSAFAQQLCGFSNRTVPVADTVDYSPVQLSLGASADFPFVTLSFTEPVAIGDAEIFFE